MRVIRESPLNFNLRFECRDCRSRLEANIDDVKMGNFSCEYGSDASVRRYYVECPVCGTRRMLEQNEITYEVRAITNKGRGEGQ